MTLADVLTALSAGGDAVMLVIGWVLLKNERRLTRLELKIFGFGLGDAPSPGGDKR